MKNKVLLVVSLSLIILGAVIANFAKFEVAQISALAVTMFGAGLAVASLWKNRKEGSKTWLVVVGLSAISIGSFLAGLTGVITEKQVTTIIGLVFSFILLIAGIVSVAIANKKTE